MPGKKLYSLLATCIALTATWWVLPVERATAHAWELGILEDSDNDFLPNCVEWAVMTNSASPDTDGDGTGDFIEVVQRGHPREPSAPLALDQEMRIVLTGPGIGSGRKQSGFICSSGLSASRRRSPTSMSGWIYRSIPACECPWPSLLRAQSFSAIA